MGTFRETWETAARAGKLLQIGLAARQVARSKGGDERVRARAALSGLFANARGMPMKIGQLLAGSSEDHVYRPLVAGIEPLPLRELQPFIEKSLGRALGQVFARFDESGSAASLGQVHRAALQDGTEVAVKVRYPDIVRAVRSELRLAGLLPGLGPVKRWGFDLGAYRTVLSENMERELDYRSEAERQGRFSQHLRVEGLAIPGPFPELCAPDLLVQSWERGHRLDQIRSWRKEDKLKVGKTLIRTLFHSLFVLGEVHGDPHEGNY